MIEKTGAATEVAAKRFVNFVRTGFRQLIIKTFPDFANV
jgi:hypothetical protein